MALPHDGDGSTASPLNRLIVVGAGEGGAQALVTVCQGLAPGLAAAILVVIHNSANHSQLPRMLSRLGLEASYARSGERISAGRIYIASTDEHLLVDDTSIHLSRGPREHHCRPAIDPLFRSAALAYAESVVGVLLTGELDDGVAGLQAIKRLGGVVVVQDPADAFSPGMPQSALEFCEVDHCLPLAEISRVLNDLSGRPADRQPENASPNAETLARLRSETQTSLVEGDPVRLLAIGRPSPFTCPDCHGGLWELPDSRPVRFRCHTGHTFTERTMERAMAIASRDALWNAYRALQERQLLLERMAENHRAGRASTIARQLSEAASELRQQAETMRSVLQRGPGTELDTSAEPRPGH
jgi:two-component system chemotaxis response regulator CheB